VTFRAEGVTVPRQLGPRREKLGFLASMKVGVVKEIKPDEYRVALTPAGARELVERGTTSLVEPARATAARSRRRLPRRRRVPRLGRGGLGEAELLLKVKEPLPDEYPRLREELVLFTYLHLAASEELTRALADSGARLRRLRDGRDRQPRAAAAARR
jgi:alanine dehydrogenase